MKKRKLTRRAALDILFADSEAFFSDARLGIPFLYRHWRWIARVFNGFEFTDGRDPKGCIPGTNGSC
jgi:hypothetical protein